MKPEAYPFLRIAKDYRVPYEHVLAIAHFVTFGDELPSHPTVKEIERYAEQNGMFEALHDDVMSACQEQNDVRHGLIDWQTGEKKWPF